MKKRIKDFREIEILKEKLRLRILKQELVIRSDLREISDNITGVAIVNRLKDNLFSGSGLAFKLGFMAVALLAKRRNAKRRK